MDITLKSTLFLKSKKIYLVSKKFLCDFKIALEFSNEEDKMKFTKILALTAALACVALAEVRILPIDKAKFIVGARFDFLVEIDGNV